MEIRMKNRKAEEWLLDAEKWSGLLGRQDLNASLEEAWWTMSFNQFHDVFTGSHPTEIYHSVLDNFAAVEKTSKGALEKVFGAKLAVRAETGEFTVISGLPYRRKAIASIPVMKGSGFSVIHDGVEIPSEISEGMLRFLVDMPAMGSATISLCPDGSSEIQWYEAERVDIENEHLSIGASAARGIEHIILKKICNSPETGTQESGSAVLVKDAGSLLVLQKDDGNFQFELPAGSEIPAMAGGAKLIICPATALGQRFRLQGDFKDNQGNALFGWETEIFLPWHEQRADVRFHIDWKAKGYRLRVKLPTVADSSGGIFEIPFGVVRRKPYMPGYNKKGEWPARRFVAAQDRSHGVALINDGVPGVETAGGTLWSTLLRAPAAEYAGMSPDDTSSQHGSHCFHFVLAPYSGDWMQAEITKKADALNNPPRIFSGNAPLPGFHVALEGATVVMSSIKSPMDGTAGEMVVRIYETAGNACTAHLEMNGSIEAWHSDITETKGKELECRDGAIELYLQPFEIRTVRIAVKEWMK
jgi:alpha-mannosidase